MPTGKSIENGETSCLMFDNVVQDVRAHVESVVSAKMGELEERLSNLLSGCAKEASVRDEADALKVLLAGVETRFREENAALFDAINEHTVATNAQTALLTTMCGEAKAMNEKLDVLCSHAGRLGHIERDVAAITKSVQGVANGTDTVSSFISGLNGHLDDIQLVFNDKANEIRKEEEEKRMAELKVQEEKRKAEEAARWKEEQEREAKRKAEATMRSSFSGNDSEVMTKGVNALKEWTGKARATIIYDSVVDEFTANRLFDKVKGKPNIAIVGFTSDGDVFGGFFSVAVTEQDGFFDPTIFAFSFESHERCETPQRFAVKKRRKCDAYVEFRKNDSREFVGFRVFGVGGFTLGNEKSKSYCRDLSSCFEGLKNTTLTGENNTGGWIGPYHCTRLVALQLE